MAANNSETKAILLPKRELAQGQEAKKMDMSQTNRGPRGWNRFGLRPRHKYYILQQVNSSLAEAGLSYDKILTG